jgi:hypothetical protein
VSGRDRSRDRLVDRCPGCGSWRFEDYCHACSGTSADQVVVIPPRRREALVQRVGRLPADIVAVIEHHRATAGRAETARVERAYRRAARLAAAVPTETPLPPAVFREPFDPADDHAARLLAGVTKEPR